MLKWIVILAMVIGSIWAFSKVKDPEQLGPVLRHCVDEGRERAGQIHYDAWENAKRAADSYRRL